jgi:pyridoxal phosphate enzyme (YggS family)
VERSSVRVDQSLYKALMTDIANNLAQIHQRITQAAENAQRNPASITLLAVSKTKPIEMIEAAYAADQRCFGENYLQDALPKIEALTELDIEWHYIGRIQSNKTRPIAEHFAWVHAIDSIKHAQRLNDQRPTGLPALNCCIQLNLSGEDSKGGIKTDALIETAAAFSELTHCRLRGLMTMPDPDSSADQQQAVFHQLASSLNELKQQGFDVDTLSMGMSGDLELAIAEGSTMVRIGTDIFGARSYP